MPGSFTTDLTDFSDWVFSIRVIRAIRGSVPAVLLMVALKLDHPPGSDGLLLGFADFQGGHAVAGRDNCRWTAAED